jgi:SAM-dependent methyltransferase
MAVNEAYDWTRYFDAVKDLPPRETVLKALELFDAERAAAQRLALAGAGGDAQRPLAIDLGCGDGRDALELLRRGWRVIAIDSTPDAVRRLMDRCPVEHMDRLEARVQRFEDARLVPCHLVVASFSIPHTDPADFPDLWKSLTRAVLPGGRFAGQLFGVKDEWAQKPDGVTRTYHTREQVDALLAEAGLVPEMLDEIERDGKNAFGEPKHWHVFHIVARKRG